MWNKCNMVVDFEGNKVQMPSVKTKEKYVYVKFDNNRYSLVNEDDYKKSLIKTTKREIKVEENDNEK